MAGCLQEKIQTVAVPPSGPRKGGWGALGLSHRGPACGPPECPLTPGACRGPAPKGPEALLPYL